MRVDKLDGQGPVRNLRVDTTYLHVFHDNAFVLYNVPLFCQWHCLSFIILPDVQNYKIKDFAKYIIFIYF